MLFLLASSLHLQTLSTMALVKHFSTCCNFETIKRAGWGGISYRRVEWDEQSFSCRPFSPEWMEGKEKKNVALAKKKLKHPLKWSHLHLPCFLHPILVAVFCKVRKKNQLKILLFLVSLSHSYSSYWEVVP